MTQATPETPGGLDQRCLKPTAQWADGGPAPSPVPPPRGLCRVLATPGRPTWHVLPVPLLPRQGVFGVLRSRAARWIVLAGVGHPLLTACMEEKGQRRIKALRVILAVQALCRLRSALLPCQHGWGTCGCGATLLPGRPAASGHAQRLVEMERSRLCLLMAHESTRTQTVSRVYPVQTVSLSRGWQGSPCP